MYSASVVLCEMLSRTFLFTPARALLGHIRCCPVAGSLQILSVSRIPNVSPFSSSCTLHDTTNKPGKSGDKGPAKNYRKKILKKQRKSTVLLGGAKRDALMEGMKAIESLTSEAQPAGHIASLMSYREKSRYKKQQRKMAGVAAGPELDAITDGIKMIETLMASEAQIEPVTSLMKGRWKTHDTTGRKTSWKNPGRGGD